MTEHQKERGLETSSESVDQIAAVLNKVLGMAGNRVSLGRPLLDDREREALELLRDELSATPQDPDEEVTQADLDRGAELDEEFGWSHTAEDAKRLRKQAAEVHADPDEEPEWPVVVMAHHPELGNGRLGRDRRGRVALSPVDDPAEYRSRPNAWPTETYYPQSHPAVLSEEEARLVVDYLSYPSVTDGKDFRPVQALWKRLEAYAAKGTQP